MCVCQSQGNLKYIMVVKYLDVQLMDYNKKYGIQGYIHVDVVTWDSL